VFWFRGCPRCSGDLYQDWDCYGRFITCVQCGFTRDIPVGAVGRPTLTAEPVPLPAVPPSQGNKHHRRSHGGRHFARTFDFKEDPAIGSLA